MERYVHFSGVWRDAAGGLSCYATIHLSYLLRLPDEPSRQAAYRQFCDDLNRARALEALRRPSPERL